MRQTRSIRINAPPERVWALIDDDRKLASWMAHVVAVRYPGGRPKVKSAGLQFVHEMRQGDQSSSYEGEITEYQPGKLVAMILKPEALAMHIVYHVEGDEDWTRLDYGCDLRARSWKGWLILGLSKRTLNRILDQQLMRLKLVAEGHTFD